MHAVVAGAHLDLEGWIAEELGRGDYASPSLVAKQLVVVLNGLLVMQLVHHDSAYSAAVLCMLPEILASGRSPEQPQTMKRLATRGG